MNTITETKFGTAFGREARLFVLSNGVLTAAFTDLGAALVSLKADGRETVLGYGDASGYERGSSSVGATVGRYAGRIGGAGFTLGGKEYRLEPNDGANHLHGTFAKRFFGAETDGDSLVFTLLSPEGEEGYPGELKLTVRASLEGNALTLAYSAETTRDTVLNITNHSYFNLNGGGSARGHRLRVFADEYAELGEGSIPTGRFINVKGTPLDFTEERGIEDALNAPGLAGTRGVDHSFILPGKGMKKAAELFSPESGLRLAVSTTQPTVHVYTSGFLAGDAAGMPLNGLPPVTHGAVCLETQHLPDSPNKPGFPTTALRKGERFGEVTEYRIS